MIIGSFGGAIQGLGYSAMHHNIKISHHASIETHVSSSSKRDFIIPPILPFQSWPRSLMQITNAVVMNAINQPFKSPYFTHKSPSEEKKPNREKRSSLDRKMLIKDRILTTQLVSCGTHSAEKNTTRREEPIKSNDPPTHTLC
jgi:hypothetical protein